MAKGGIVGRDGRTLFETERALGEMYEGGQLRLTHCAFDRRIGPEVLHGGRGASLDDAAIEAGLLYRSIA